LICSISIASPHEAGVVSVEDMLRGDVLFEHLLDDFA
jgi:hypothetical protein